MSPRHRISRPAALVAALAFVLSAALTLSSCTSSTDVLVDDLDDAIALWKATRPDSYVALETRSCECLPSESGPVVLQVQRTLILELEGSERIVGGTYPNGGEAVPDAVLEHFLTAADLFALVRRALDEGAPSVEVEYDRHRGYPRSVAIDWDAAVADEESIYQFEVLDGG